MCGTCKDNHGSILEGWEVIDKTKTKKLMTDKFWSPSIGSWNDIVNDNGIFDQGVTYIDFVF